ncbi:double-strand break repair protein, putative [Eimeria maxima]|uniref:Double-strand break repair protein, putative n=1 Tax=Eimeria maxima TaxID=5804 RepID=U6MEK7_EIMMA|nr:double-strand break repair protein, putative [Eimeria maxima]CDJ60899.1 double-strand break repair protein, putative [Eimeria maxima]
MCLLRKYCLGPGAVLFDVLSSSNTTQTNTKEYNNSSSSSSSAAAASQGQTQQQQQPTQPQQTQEQLRQAAAAEAAAAAAAEAAAAADTFRFGLNYLNENINVCMPFFAMHGNHDDPGDASHLSPLDILEAAHLINYFGRVDNIEDIRIRPILLKKGTSKVTYEVPADEPTENWFNLLLVHQNMYKGAHGGSPAKNCLLEKMLPPFMDIVIWG